MTPEPSFAAGYDTERSQRKLDVQSRSWNDHFLENESKNALVHNYSNNLYYTNLMHFLSFKLQNFKLRTLLFVKKIGMSSLH